MSEYNYPGFLIKNININPSLTDFTVVEIIILVRLELGGRQGGDCCIWFVMGWEGGGGGRLNYK